MNKLVDVFVGRQPILDREMNLFAYELLFRGNSEDNRALVVGGDSASAQVMLSAFGDIGLPEVVGDHRAFINFTEGLLNPEYEAFFPRRHIVIEVLESVVVTPQLIASLQHLKQKGFVIALDDYVFNPALEVLEDYADIIKVDILEVGPKPLIEHAAKLRAKGIKLLAEKVETKEQFEYCKKLGFDYFQGYFFARPNIVQGKRLPANKLAILELLSRVYDPDIDLRKLSELISRDLTMSQKLLGFVSSNLRMQREIRSIHDAVVQFGLQRLKSWTSMLVIAGVDDKPIELFKTALIRAKFCELVGSRLRESSVDTYFTVGLFSSLDAVMDTEMKSLLDKMNLCQEVKLALLQRQGKLGVVLDAVCGLEKGATDFALPQGVSGKELSTLYLQAMRFAEEAKLF
jgi:EAL and modified HD-GYP domain-containing signal transduction protein